MCRINLFDSQGPAFQFLARRGSGHAALELPTGMGKTVILVALIGLLLRRGKKIIVAAPQEHIEDGFVHRSYTQIGTPLGVIDMPLTTIRAARENPKIIDAIREFIEGPQRDYALACTHLALTHFRPPTGVPEDLANCVLIVDEGHHAPALGFSQFVDAFVANGGQVIYASATMFRTDNEPVIRHNMEVFRVSLPRFMAEGGAPRKFRSKINVIRLNHRAEYAAMIGEEDPAHPFRRRIVREMVARWQEDDRPKVIVRVPALRGGTSKMISQVVRAFRRVGARVLDVSGQDQAAKTRFHEALIAERALNRFADSQWDVMVGIQRVREGMDWKWCSTVYCVGLPNSIQMITQLMGRASRKKQGWWRYPRSHREVMQIEFYVPCGDPASFRDLPRRHSQNVLLICAFLENYERNLDWRVVQELHRGLVAPLHEPGESPTSGVERHREAYVDPALHDQVRALVTTARQELLNLDRDPSVGNTYRWVVEHHPSAPRTVLAHVMCEIIVLDEGCSMTEARTLLFKELNAKLAEGEPLRDALISAFMAVLHGMESHNILRAEDVQSERLRRRVFQLTGEDMQNLATELARRRPLQPDWLIDVCNVHRIRTDNLPTGSTRGGPRGWEPETWAGIDQAIRTNDRAWPISQIQSLEEFCRIYVRPRGGGTIADVLQVAARDTGLLSTAATRHLLDSFVSRQVQINGDESLTPLRDLPAFPAARERRHYPRIENMLAVWLNAVRDIVDEPVTLTHAWIVCHRLARWLQQHRSDAMAVGGLDRVSRQQFTQAWAGTSLMFQVRAADTYLQDLRPWLYPATSAEQRPHPIRSGQLVYATMLRCPFSPASSGEVSISRTDQDEMLGSRLLDARCIPVDVTLVHRAYGRHNRDALYAVNAEDYPGWHGSTPPARSQTMALQVPAGWFTHWISMTEEQTPVYAQEPIRVRSTLRRLPEVLAYNGHQEQ